jgi:hypothetical protein
MGRQSLIETNSRVQELQHFHVYLLFIISPLTHICNVILNTGVFPDRLKFAIVKPLFLGLENRDYGRGDPLR